MSKKINKNDNVYQIGINELQTKTEITNEDVIAIQGANGGDIGKVELETAISELGYTKNNGTVESVEAGTGLKILGTATVNPKVIVDTSYILPKRTEWDSKSSVSGETDGTNWTSITIDGNTYTIPTSSGGSVKYEDLEGKYIIVDILTYDTGKIDIGTLEFGKCFNLNDWCFYNYNYQTAEWEIATEYVNSGMFVYENCSQTMYYMMDFDLRGSQIYILKPLSDGKMGVTDVFYVDGGHYQMDCFIPLTNSYGEKIFYDGVADDNFEIVLHPFYEYNGEFYELNFGTKHIISLYNNSSSALTIHMCGAKIVDSLRFIGDGFDANGNFVLDSDTHAQFEIVMKDSGIPTSTSSRDCAIPVIVLRNTFTNYIYNNN